MQRTLEVTTEQCGSGLFTVCMGAAQSEFPLVVFLMFVLIFCSFALLALYCIPLRCA